MPDFIPDEYQRGYQDALAKLRAEYGELQTEYGPRATKAWVRYGTLIGAVGVALVCAIAAMWYGGWPRVFLSGLCAASLAVGLIAAVAPAVIPQTAPFRRKPDA